MQFDLVVIGGGAAGLAAARAARRRDAKVALISSAPLGGDCTFYGCVPSKTLIESARHGLGFAAAMARVRATVDDIAAGESAEVLRREGVEVIEGTARLSGPGRVAVGGTELRCRRLVLATGSSPAIPPVEGIGGVEALTNETVFDLTSQPEALLIMGGGPIGVELGQAFARLGTAVTIVEAAARLIGREEPEASSAVSAALSSCGVDVRTGRQVRSVNGSPGSLLVELDDGTRIEADRLLVAAGRRPHTEGLGLDRAGVSLDRRGHIVADTRLRTSASGVYAAGDVTGLAPFTHAADEMGRIAANNALAPAPWRRFRPDAIPAVTYTAPEVARVDLTEEQAAAIPGAKVAELPLCDLDRAITAGETNGYIKLIAAPRKPIGNLAGGRLVGATIVAERAGEMIAVPTMALRAGMFPARLALTVQAYPTWTLGVRQAAAQLFIETGGRRARPARGKDRPAITPPGSR